MPTAHPTAPPPTGIRVRKRERTRLAIADAAFELFAEHGFDAVRLTEVAAAADVAPATVFTHFDSKEDLFFFRRQELNEHVFEAVAPAATTAELLSQLKESYRSAFRRLHSPDVLDRSRVFARILLDSPTLRRTYLGVVRERQEVLTAALLDLAPDGADTAELALFARLVAAVSTAAHEELHRGMAAGEPVERLQAAADEILDRGFALLTRAYEGTALLTPG
ncbi:TetR/AcrR family transcriptional regulator [Kitasatospora sp. HPMI-4]|uniref:TetR/AcrR family transcriptional regulator n=1 Tax=Kitasatospora sp. HPMI-4 TaxID=3448443 RepID=UPI003F1CDC87